MIRSRPLRTHHEMRAAELPVPPVGPDLPVLRSHGKAGASVPFRTTACSTLETFFANFDQLADASDSVEKLRELVLQLAVHGKLVEQNEADGQASRIFENKSDRSHKPTVIEADARYEVPTSWMWIRFAAVGEQRLGKMLDQKGNRGDLKPYLRNTNVQWMRFQLDD